MASVKDIYGSVYVNSSADLLARVVDANGDPVLETDIVSIVYTIRERDACSDNAGTVVPGHDEVPLTASEVIMSELLTDSAWSIDGTGYNFRHAIDTTTNEAFMKAGYSYQVRYDLFLVDGQTVVFRYELKAI